VSHDTRVPLKMSTSPPHPGTASRRRYKDRVENVAREMKGPGMVMVFVSDFKNGLLASAGVDSHFGSVVWWFGNSWVVRKKRGFPARAQD
jgi:hypothetical protein